jgi:hypothetical protein
MGFDELKRAVINFEKARFLETTHLDRTRPGCSIEFTEVGRYDELLDHIREHKWYINLKQDAEIPFEDAAASWYDAVFYPIIRIVRETRLLASCPPCTEADLYVYVGRHWSELGKRYGPLFTLEEAAEDFSIVSRKKRVTHWARRLGFLLAGIFRRRKERGNQAPRV